jgi:type II secretory pathway pseudopilin PulG
MFRINAFGQRVYCNPRLRFVETTDGDAGQGAGADDAPGDDTSTQNGFPANTPLEQMTAPEQAAYWKHESKKHQRAANARSDYDDLKAKAAELEQLQQANQSAEEAAIEAARRDGEVIGASRYLKEAVKGRFQGITKKTDEEVETIFEHVDALSFTDDKGDIDVEKLTKYAGTFGVSDATVTTEDPVAAALGRQRLAGGGSGSSISERRKEVRESMTRKTA